MAKVQFKIVAIFTYQSKIDEPLAQAVALDEGRYAKDFSA